MIESILPKIDIDCLIFTMILNNLFGLVPRYRFATGKASKENKMYCLIWILVHFSCVMYYVYVCSSFLLHSEINEIRVTEMTLRVLDILGFSILPAIGICKTFFFGSKSWHNFFQDIKYADKYFKAKEMDRRRKVLYLYLILSVGHGIMIILVILTVWLNNPFDTAFLAAIYFWETYNIFMYNAFIAVVAMFLHTSFRNLNELVDHLVCSPAALRNLREIENLFKVLCHATQYFNRIFGSQLLGLTAYIVVDLLDLMNLWMLHFLSRNQQQQLPLYIYQEFFYFILLSVTYGCIVFSCDFAEKEAQRLIEICYRLQGRLDQQPLVRQEVLVLAQTANALAPNFSAAGFVEVDRKIILHVINAVLVYLVIIISFNNGDQSCTGDR